MTQDHDFLPYLIRWAKGQPLVRAMILTSSRAIPQGTGDLLSDYDVILALQEVHPFYAGRDWLAAFGRVLALYRDPLEIQGGLPKGAYVVQFEDGLKIDFTLWPLEVLKQVVAADRLPDEFDAGYQVLLDKDGLTEGLKPPTYQAYIPKPPSQELYREYIEAFFLEAIYVAKFLWRGDLVAAKYLLDHFMKHEHLLPMLEWHIELEQDWQVRPGLYGQRLKRWLRPDLWVALEGTYTGMHPQANWEALEKTMQLMRVAALEVGERLGYAYLQDVDQRTHHYIERVKHLDRGA